MAKDDLGRPGGLSSATEPQASRPYRASIPDAAWPKQCEFPGTGAACQRCEKCVSILARRAAVAAPHAELIALQSKRRCRICDRIERYCQTDGQGRGRHKFAPVLTCESCRHMGGVYWPDIDFPKHHCRKSNERRAASFRSCGDFAEDFMRQFRTFYDAAPRQSAENCRFFEPLTAQAIEARRAETGTGSVEDESAVSNADAPPTSPTSSPPQSPEGA